MRDLFDGVSYSNPFLFVFAFLFFISLSFVLSPLFLIASLFVFALGFHFNKKLLPVFVFFALLFFLFFVRGLKHSICENPRKGVITNISEGKRLNLMVKSEGCRLYLFVSPRYRGLRVGEIITFRAKLKSVKTVKSKGFSNYLRSLSVARVGYAGRIRVVGESQPLSFFNRIRSGIEREFHYFLPSRVEYFLSSAILGDGRFRSKIKREFINTQTAHIMAVSGLHMGFVFGMFYLLFYYLFSLIGYIYRRFNLKVVASLAAFLPTLIYFSISGLHIPAIRSFLMIVLFVLSLIFSKTRSSLNILFLIASLFISINYLAIMNPSFVMSFLMTFFALMLYSPLKKANLNKTLKTFVFMLLMSLLAMPISSYYFGRISPISVAANLVAVPLFGFVVVPISFVGIFASFLPYSIVKIYIFKVVSLVGLGFLKIIAFFSSLATPVDIKLSLTVVLAIYFSATVLLVMVDKHLLHQGNQPQTLRRISF